MKNVRLHAAESLLAVVEFGRSLKDVLPEALATIPLDQQGFYKQLVYGSTRYYFALDELANHLLEKPIKPKERIVHMVLLVGLYQLWKLDIAAHAAINETVNALKAAKRPWAKAMVNANLRRFQRERDALLKQLNRSESFPGWLNKRLHKAYSELAMMICQASNHPGPMTLRVNVRKQSREAWLDRARIQGLQVKATPYAISGVSLESPVSVGELPGFLEGAVSVQDEAAQMCASLLNPQAGEWVLDSCAAPGGKSAHLLEWNDIALTVLDSNEKRLVRVQQTLERIGQKAICMHADASKLDEWWSGDCFDAILLDAPCSGTGVIRRNPDIKLLRKSADIKALVQLQRRLLNQLWLTLKPGGRLLYATCSILPDENDRQIDDFLSAHPDAVPMSLPIHSDHPVQVGAQWLPQVQGYDGFYFALLQKASVESDLSTSVIKS